MIYSELLDDGSDALAGPVFPRPARIESRLCVSVAGAPTEFSCADAAIRRLGRRVTFLAAGLTDLPTFGLAFGSLAEAAAEAFFLGLFFLGLFLRFIRRPSAAICVGYERVIEKSVVLQHFLKRQN